MDAILDRGAAPDMAAIGQYIQEPARRRWLELVSHIENAYRSKPQVAYGVCAGRRGWNARYKKGGKALCTLYPEPDSFLALIVPGAEDIARFEAERAAYTDEVSRLFEQTKPVNGMKRLMIRVSGDGVLSDIKRLFELKLKP